MQATIQTAARRSWLEAERRALPLATPEAGQTFSQTFINGFLRGSMLQMAVCAPPRQAVSRPVDAVLIARLGERADARGARTAQRASAAATA